MMSTDLEGTDSRVMRWVRGSCGHCGDEDVLLYVAGDRLVCAEARRVWGVNHPHQQACDECGATGNVWRDPLTRRNEYFCASHHDPDAMFQNRWALKARESTALGIRERVRCATEGITECRGEIKWRGGFNMLLCNKHAGKQGVGPNG